MSVETSEEFEKRKAAQQAILRGRLEQNRLRLQANQRWGWGTVFLAIAAYAFGVYMDSGYAGACFFFTIAAWKALR